MNKASKKNGLLNLYYRYPIIIDFLIITVILLIVNSCRGKLMLNNINPDSFLSNIISTIVSFSGFILASLTIIVTVKANLKMKEINEASNGLELLLLSKENYKQIIRAFRDAIIELVVSLFILYFFWQPIVGLNPYQISLLSIFGFSIIILTLCRTLYLLFRIIFLETKDED
jgi:hypothetical protein